MKIYVIIFFYNKYFIRSGLLICHQVSSKFIFKEIVTSLFTLRFYNLIF
jgi:hypothetical protein